MKAVIRLVSDGAPSVALTFSRKLPRSESRVAGSVVLRSTRSISSASLKVEATSATNVG